MCDNSDCHFDRREKSVLGITNRFLGRRLPRNDDSTEEVKNMLKKISLIVSLILINNLTFADGFIVIPRPNPLPNPFPLEVLYHKVDIKIDGQSAITTIDQSFYNPSEFQLEGFYIFPIPKGAVINNFTMIINGKETNH